MIHPFLIQNKESCLAGESGYIDKESGLFVLNSYYLRDQEECCGSGCRHCPFSKTEQDLAGRSNSPAFPFHELADDQ